MITMREGMPLTHIRFSKFTFGLGIAMMMASMFIILTKPALTATLGVGLAFTGLAVAFVSILYWGCGNKSCSPW
jgi:hypothetical protein